MVDISDKVATHRRATAQARMPIVNKSTLNTIRGYFDKATGNRKGDLVSVA